MAITTCKECKAQVSTNASKCPHCGIRLKTSVFILIPLGLTVFVGAYIGIQLIPRSFHLIETPAAYAATPTVDKQREAPVTTSNRKVFELSHHSNYLLSSLLNNDTAETAHGKNGFASEVLFEITATANEITKTYDDNEIAGDQKYLNKIIKVSGEIETIGSDFQNNPFITFSTENQLKSPIAKLKKDEISRIAKLKKGQKIYLVCAGSGEIASIPTLHECEFLDSYVNARDPHLFDKAKSYLNGETIEARIIPTLNEIIAATLLTESIVPSDSKCYLSISTGDLIACMNTEIEKASKIFAESSPETKAALRKKLTDNIEQLKSKNLDGIADQIQKSGLLR